MKITRIIAYQVDLPLHEGSYKWSGGKSVSVFDSTGYTQHRVARAMHISGWYALTTPLGAGVFAAMMFTSAWKVLSGRGVTWKGRTYDPKKIR